MCVAHTPHDVPPSAAFQTLGDPIFIGRSDMHDGLAPKVDQQALTHVATRQPTTDWGSVQGMRAVVRILCPPPATVKNPTEKHSGNVIEML